MYSSKATKKLIKQPIKTRKTKYYTQTKVSSKLKKKITHTLLQIDWILKSKMETELGLKKTFKKMNK